MSESKVVKWYVRLLWSIGIPVTIIISVLLYWLIAPSTDVTYSSDYSLSTEYSTYKAGDRVLVVSKGKYCNSGVETRVERRMENNIGGIILPPVFFFEPQDPVCISNNTFQFQIPGDIPPGLWKLTLVTTYKANPVRAVEAVSSTNFFEVK